MQKQSEFIVGQPLLRKPEDGVAIPVEYGGVIYKCIVAAQVLKECVSSPTCSLLESYKQNKQQIDGIIKELLLSRSVGQNTEVLITAEAFRGLTDS